MNVLYKSIYVLGPLCMPNLYSACSMDNCARKIHSLRYKYNLTDYWYKGNKCFKRNHHQNYPTPQWFIRVGFGFLGSHRCWGFRRITKYNWCWLHLSRWEIKVWYGRLSLIHLRTCTNKSTFLSLQYMCHRKPTMYVLRYFSFKLTV